MDKYFDTIKPKTEDHIGLWKFINYPNVHHICLNLLNETEGTFN